MQQNNYMKAVVFDDFGDADVLLYSDTAKPKPRNDEVLIRVQAAGVNRPDILQRQGHYPPPKGASDILGLEVAGIIEETGERVCALLEGGGYAEFAVARRAQCLPIPKGISMIEAAALPECIATVWKNVFMLGAFQAGHVALVHGGTSGIGSTAI